MDGGYRCKLAGQKVARLWVHPECLPGDIVDLTLRPGHGVGQKDLDITIVYLQMRPSADPAFQEAAVCLPVAPVERGASGRTEEATTWACWLSALLCRFCAR